MLPEEFIHNNFYLFHSRSLHVSIIDVTVEALVFLNTKITPIDANVNQDLLEFIVNVKVWFFSWNSHLPDIETTSHPKSDVLELMLFHFSGIHSLSAVSVRQTKCGREDLSRTLCPFFFNEIKIKCNFIVFKG